MVAWTQQPSQLSCDLGKTRGSETTHDARPLIDLPKICWAPRMNQLPNTNITNAFLESPCSISRELVLFLHAKLPLMPYFTAVGSQSFCDNARYAYAR